MATGVIPAHRGKHVFANLFALAQQALKQSQVEQYYLEVLQQNERAVALYKRQGFFIAREFVVLNGSAQKGSRQSERVQYADFAGFDFQLASVLNRSIPSYEHSDHILKLHPDRCHVAYIKVQDISAWCIFSNTTGQIFQLGWNNISDLQEVVQSLLVRYPQITAKNIEATQHEVLEMLASLHFKVVAKQYEMVRNICSG